MSVSDREFPDSTIEGIEQVQIKCGLFMGDYSRTGIHTMFNTGTVVGVSTHVFGTGFQSKFIPSFSWGDQNGTYQLEKAISAARSLHSFKSDPFSDLHEGLLRHIFEKTKKYRQT